MKNASMISIVCAVGVFSFMCGQFFLPTQEPSFRALLVLPPIFMAIGFVISSLIVLLDITD